jgi:hypothetical protein
MNTEFYRLIGSLQSVIHFIDTQYHNAVSGAHGPETDLTDYDPDRERLKRKEPHEVEEQLDVLRRVTRELLAEHAKISHAYFDFRRALSRNAEAFYHAINKLRRKAPEWQIMDEDLLQLIDHYQATASSLFFGGGPPPYPMPPSSSSS